MGPDRNCRQLNCPVPIAHRGGGSAEVALEAAFSYNIHGRKTCHNEKRKSFNSNILVRLSYKKGCLLLAGLFGLRNEFIKGGDLVPGRSQQICYLLR